MRCAYHGWKFGLDGQCEEMPSEPPESGFASKVKTAAYPCVEAGGVVFAYMGPESAPPPLPELEWTLLPEGHTFTSRRVQDCNWFQALEGGIDSSHISFLHAPIDHRNSEVTQDMDRVSFGVGAAVSTGDRAPRFEVVDTDYGVLDRRPSGQPGRPLVLARHPVPAPVLHDAAHRSGRARRAVAHLGADGRHPRGELDGHLAPGPQAHAGGDPAPRRGQGRARLRLRAGHLRALRRCAHRGQPRERLLHGLGGPPHPDVLRDPRLRGTGPGGAGEPGRHRRPQPGAPRQQRHRDHPGAPAHDDGRARAPRARHARPGRRTRAPSWCAPPPWCWPRARAGWTAPARGCWCGRGTS